MEDRPEQPKVDYVFVQETGVPKKSTSPRRLPTPSSPQCQRCNTRTTPLWRRGPDGTKSLCNACGLQFLRHVQKEKALEKKTSKNDIKSLLN
mmetsp:Transcript_2314/g.8231  ORF Transcript_2314/g.8231 Transcript_2314/m.8231 type:complete len:92 (-) Transcript_2314:57-332(-)